jgi:hypothetical protein
MNSQPKRLLERRFVLLLGLAVFGYTLCCSQPFLFPPTLIQEREIPPDAGPFVKDWYRREFTQTFTPAKFLRVFAHPRQARIKREIHFWGRRDDRFSAVIAGSQGWDFARTNGKWRMARDYPVYYAD